MRIWNNASQSDVFKSGFFEIGFQLIDKSGTDSTLSTEMNQHFFCPIFFQQRTCLKVGIFAKDDTGWCIIFEISHNVCYAS